ncbi:MAG: energy transducer TonB [Pseudomonadota bacterium]
MIATSRRIAGTALIIAGALHLLGVTWLVPVEQAQMDGGQVGAAEASLGDAFETVATGTLTGVETTDKVEEVPVEDVVDAMEAEASSDKRFPEEVTKPLEPVEPTDQRTVGDLAQAVETRQFAERVTTQTGNAPQETTKATPDALPATRLLKPKAPTVALSELPVPTTQASQALIARPLLQPQQTTEAETLRTEDPDKTQAPPVSTPRQSAEVLTALTPIRSLQTTGADTMRAEDPGQPQVTQSLRPKVRSGAFEDRHKPRPLTPQRTTRAAPETTRAPTARGNQAQTNRQIGQQDGAATAAPARRATGGNNAVRAGNAAVTNYPGQVMRKIQRVRRPRVGVRSSATVAFRIAGNGGLGALSIARSSGNTQLDQAALQVIRSAAPFPAPPPGARRSFSIQIKGR